MLFPRYGESISWDQLTEKHGDVDTVRYAYGRDSLAMEYAKNVALNHHKMWFVDVHQRTTTIALRHAKLTWRRLLDVAEMLLISQQYAEAAQVLDARKIINHGLITWPVDTDMVTYLTWMAYVRAARMGLWANNQGIMFELGVDPKRIVILQRSGYREIGSIDLTFSADDAPEDDEIFAANPDMNEHQVEEIQEMYEGLCYIFSRYWMQNQFISLLTELTGDNTSFSRIEAEIAEQRKRPE